MEDPYLLPFPLSLFPSGSTALRLAVSRRLPLRVSFWPREGNHGARWARGPPNRTQPERSRLAGARRKEEPMQPL